MPYQTQRGSTLFYAILISGVFLVVALGLSNVATQQSQFASFTRDSQTAFYAADTGIECALYWDYVHTDAPVFPTTDTQTTRDFTCINYTIHSVDKGLDYEVDADSSSTWTYATTTFWMPMEDGNNNVPCTEVEVGKYEHNATGNTKTIIIARGYNIADNKASYPRCDAAPLQSRRVQRALQVQYGFNP